MTTTTKAQRIFQILEPSLKRTYRNGSWVYETEYGYKTKEGLMAVIESVLSADWATA